MLFVVILGSLIISSLIFNEQIRNLKKQVDNIYFGNFVPLQKLERVVQDYKDIKLVLLRDVYKFSIEDKKDDIFKNWSYYHSIYKTHNEKMIVDKISQDIEKSFKNLTLGEVNEIIAKVEFLINYEIDAAQNQRKEFLAQYDQMKQYLTYNLIAIILFTFIFVVWIVIQLNKHQSQLEELNNRYKIESITDGLTKMYNRAYFDMIFDKMTDITREYNSNSAFIMIDIDFFKQYNDTYGHDKGDEVLKVFARTLKQYFNRELEYVFRLGGEEFGVIMFDTDEKIVRGCLDGFKESLEKLKIEHKKNQASSYVTASMGVVIIEPSNTMIPRELYKAADQKLYQSKENGRDQYTI
jgi:diguanylate cyclase (GGDEF)-like protein